MFVGQEPSLRRLLLDMMRPRIVIPQHKLSARIRVTKEIAVQMISTPTLVQRLDMAVQQAEERLRAVTEAREIFKRNPDMEKLLNIMQKGLF